MPFLSRKTRGILCLHAIKYEISTEYLIAYLSRTILVKVLVGHISQSFPWLGINPNPKDKELEAEMSLRMYP
jgi:hypothetical protein